MSLAFGNVENTDWKYTDTGGSPAASLALDLVTYVTGDLILLVACIDDSTIDFTTPSGYDLELTRGEPAGNYTVFSRTSDGTEGSTVTLSLASGSVRIQGTSLKLTGHDSSAVVDVFADSSVGGGSNYNCPSITTTVANTIGFFGVACTANSNYSGGDEPNSTTLVKESTNSGQWMGLVFEEIAAIGATGTRQWTNTQQAKVTFSFAITPSAAAPYPLEILSSRQRQNRFPNLAM